MLFPLTSPSHSPLAHCHSIRCDRSTRRMSNVFAYGNDASAAFERPTYSASNCICLSAVLQTAVFQAASSAASVCVCTSVCGCVCVRA